jgi:hypothetical protein
MPDNGLSNKTAYAYRNYGSYSLLFVFLKLAFGIQMQAKLLSPKNQGMELVNAMTMAGLPPTILSLQEQPAVSSEGNKLMCPTLAPTLAPTRAPTPAPTVQATMLAHREELVNVRGKLEDLGAGAGQVAETSGSEMGR